MTKSLKVQYDEGCKHCPCNPKARQPFIEKPVIEYTELTKKLLPSVSKDWGIPEECIVCLSRATLWAHPFLMDKPTDMSKFK
jgi:hypothetical protein